MDPIQEIIANNLMKIRKSKGLSLDKVSELTGVSKAMLAQIEKGKSNPTVSTLWKIANGLQVSFSSFLKEEKPKITKINIEELSPVIDADGNYIVYTPFPYHPEKKFEIYLVKLNPGFTYTSAGHAGEEYILIKHGELKVGLKGEEYRLKSGDALHFTPSGQHDYTNETEELASFFMLIYYPE
ncbi:transcriptional regulator with XRE-family HTH domain [Scopulibacillus daqui]|uniref:Transcriptional regulator with XRE-family HTH domain n=1 Tax=Scopulibacillus daqui TaxID=1469162 RepID=A0ABS2Q3A2_9BACL|nr:XRE family transcriptional regulator [Scopulibacillus daqui]MBM7646773.1 transcriptional regulator with XRE-family HTH domain [Scopulibacillus daqui]